jgi:hypothetical protein
MIGLINNIRSLVAKFGIYLRVLAMFLMVCTALYSPSTSYGQIKPDSLANDSLKKTIRIKSNKKDSSTRIFVLNKLFRGGDSLVQAGPAKKIPGRAGLFSALVPGLGQAYNEKYWKIPIIYSVFAGLYFIGEDSNSKYLLFRRAYSKEYVDPSIAKYSPENLRENMVYYKRNRDLNIIMGVAAYLLNILDASVDAHLMDYDISDDLSLNIQPDFKTFQTNNYSKNTSFGLKFVISF